MSTFDLAVIGGGFAGMACAASASARGVRTVVLDRKPQPGAKPHTTGILVKEAADEWDVPRRLTRKIFGVRLYAPSGDSFDLHSPGYYFLATDTPGVLQWLSRRAAARGACIRFGQPCTEFRRESDRWMIDPGSVAARWMVGADGARSVVARRLGLGENRKFLVGVEAEFEGVRGVDGDFLHVFIDSALAPGYIAWIVPGVTHTQVGLACKTTCAPQLERFLELVRGRFDFSHAVEVSKRRGLIPVGGMVRPLSCEGAMLVGDSGGMVSPLTAGGIHTALKYGRQAGVAVANHLLDGGPDPARTLQQSVERFGLKHAMRWAIDREPPNALLNVMLKQGVVRAMAQTVFYHHRGLMTRAAWRDVIGSCIGLAPGRAAHH